MNNVYHYIMLILIDPYSHGSPNYTYRLKSSLFASLGNDGHVREGGGGFFFLPTLNAFQRSGYKGRNRICLPMAVSHSAR